MDINERYKDEPRVKLGGVEWAIPPLSGRRIIRFGDRALGVTVRMGMTEPEMMKVYEAIYIGVSQGLEKDQLSFDDWLDNYSVTFEEILAALPIIGRQAGMEIKETKTGEAEAKPVAGSDSSQTGTT